MVPRWKFQSIICLIFSKITEMERVSASEGEINREHQPVRRPMLDLAARRDDSPL